LSHFHQTRLDHCHCLIISGYEYFFEIPRGGGDSSVNYYFKYTPYNLHYDSHSVAVTTFNGAHVVDKGKIIMKGERAHLKKLFNTSTTRVKFSKLTWGIVGREGKAMVDKTINLLNFHEGVRVANADQAAT
jgi:hypothetical protein